MEPPLDLLGRPAEEAARLMALGHLDAVTKARRRLDDPADPEALHDFRVALRRLRSCLRSYRAELDRAVSRPARRRLRRLARTAGHSRDLEVQIEWAEGQLADATPVEGTAIREWLEGLHAVKRQADARLGRRLDRTFGRTMASLERRLEDYRRHLRVEAPDHDPAAPRIADRVRGLAQDLERALAEIRSADDVAAAHAARIAAKHLRYAIEPVEALVDGATPIGERLGTLQDDLGELHDASIALTSVEQVRSDTAQPGVAALIGRLHDRMRSGYDRVHERWLAGATGSLFGEIRRFADRVDAHGTPQEIERKYLLSALPPHVAGGPALEVEQGRLPGTRVIERLRHVRSDGAEHWYRTVKLGRGLVRAEFEEETDAAFFGALWPLTEGRRVNKRRYRAQAADLEWEIDEFTDRELVLAEIELPAANTEVDVPAWLAPYVVREVTHDPEYTNYRLAR